MKAYQQRFSNKFNVLLSQFRVKFRLWGYTLCPPVRSKRYLFVFWSWRMKDTLGYTRLGQHLDNLLFKTYTNELATQRMKETISTIETRVSKALIDTSMLQVLRTLKIWQFLYILFFETNYWLFYDKLFLWILFRIFPFLLNWRLRKYWI